MECPSPMGLVNCWKTGTKDEKRAGKTRVLLAERAAKLVERVVKSLRRIMRLRG
jgi:hypothetical protein